MTRQTGYAILAAIVLAVVTWALAAKLESNSAGAHHDVIVIGADPAYFDAVLDGAKTWNETGLVLFAVQMGCEKGEIHVCYGVPRTDAIAAYQPMDGTIRVHIPELFTAGVACHELGHALGLIMYVHYEDGSTGVTHRDEGESCMVVDGDGFYPNVVDSVDTHMVHELRHPVRDDGTNVSQQESTS